MNHDDLYWYNAHWNLQVSHQLCRFKIWFLYSCLFLTWQKNCVLWGYFIVWPPGVVVTRFVVCSHRYEINVQPIICFTDQIQKCSLPTLNIATFMFLLLFYPRIQCISTCRQGIIHLNMILWCKVPLDGVNVTFHSIRIWLRLLLSQLCDV